MHRQTTFFRADAVEKQWHVVDATDQVLGRLASRLATILMGKHRPQYTPFMDTGDFVVVINASKLRLTGNKAQDKYYLTYSRYPGGQKARSYGDLLEHQPEKLLEVAVRRMLPKTHLADKMLKKLKVYGGADHPHAAQQPQPLEVQV